MGARSLVYEFDMLSESLATRVELARGPPLGLLSRTLSDFLDRRQMENLEKAEGGVR
jgi:hypothetical protein